MQSSETNGDRPVARCTAGAVRGVRIGGVAAFKGVPYAQGGKPYRFRRAGPREPFGEVFDAVGPGARCYQTAGLAQPFFAPIYCDSPDDEDCLNLDIWTPAVGDGGKRPVMVWLHGGAFTSGSGHAPAYDGARLAERGDVVVVTVTHRLNVFGYLYLPDLLGPDYAESGNVGLLDIVAALRWVRENIAAFGGDASNVTLFGESAGGAKISLLMAMPEAEGLFHKAIVQSGAYLVSLRPEDACEVSRKIAHALGSDGEDARVLLEVTAEDLVAAVTRALPDQGALTLKPVVDGLVLPRPPFSPDAPPGARAIPLLIGSNETEQSVMLGGLDAPLAWEQIPGLLRSIMAGFRGLPPMTESDLQAMVAAARSAAPDASPAETAMKLCADATFRRAVIREAELKTRQGGAPTYVYLLAWKTPLDGGRWGTPHCLDIPLVMNNLAAASAMLDPAADDAQELANRMSDAWIAFARTGVPAVAGADWPAYDLETRPTMIFGASPRIVRDPDGAVRRILAGGAPAPR